MLNTTFKKLHEAGACTSGYRKLAEHLGGVNKYGDEVTIPLSEILKSNGLDDAVWCLRATIEPAENYIIEFACRCAEHVLVNYEKLYPDDKRPRQAIEAARVCITDKSTHAAAHAAADAAADAAYAAHDADAAAHDAAHTAADKNAMMIKILQSGITLLEVGNE